MDYMKGYINRNRRRRASRHRTKRGRRTRSSNSDSYYMSRSKYSGSAGHQFSKKYVAAAAGLAAAFLLVIVGIFIFQPFKGDGNQGQVASGSAAAGAEASAGVKAADVKTTELPEVKAESNEDAREDSQTEPQATMDPDGIAAVIAALPTIQPDIVPTPEPQPRSKAVALTFDDGPSTENTPKVLELLKKYNAHATFFVVGTRVSAGAEVLKQEVAQGCEIGNHSWDHANLAAMSMKKVNKEYDKTANLVKKLVGFDVTLLRPPYGAISQKMRNKLKHPMILWNVDTLDWKSKNTNKIMHELKKNVKDGDIILMHDIHPTTAEALNKVLPWLIKNDYDILTVSELAARKGAKLTNGKAYGGFSGQ